MKRIVIALATLGWISCQTAHAAAIGEIERTAKVGFAGSMLNLSVEDPDGPTSSETDFSLINLFYTDLFLDDYRYWAEFFYHSATLEASTSNIGQDVDRMGLRLSMQKWFNIASAWDFYGGVGAYVSKEDFTNRYTKDVDGFLLQRYNDRSENILGALIEGVASRKVSERWDIMFRAAYEIPFGDGVEAITFSAGLLYGL